MYCDVKMGIVDRVLRVGERVTPFLDEPCVSYVCTVSRINDRGNVGTLCTLFPLQNNGELRIEIETCTSADEVCVDGKAPYKIPGECCSGCSKYNDIEVLHHLLIDHCMHAEFIDTASFTLEIDTQLDFNETDKPTSLPPNSWTPWSSWSECSKSCGGGRRSRKRQCKTTDARELDCTGLTVDIRDCNTHHCPSK